MDKATLKLFIESYLKAIADSRRKGAVKLSSEDLKRLSGPKPAKWRGAVYWLNQDTESYLNKLL
jgi:hypothetical protein